MTDVPASPRRRDRNRAPRSTGPSLTPLPRLTNPWAPLEILNAEQVERILNAAFRVLEEAGLEIRSTAARDEFLRGGALVDDETQMVRLGREVVDRNCGARGRGGRELGWRDQLRARLAAARAREDGGER